MLLATAKTLENIRPWVYVLACENDTFYVGFSRRLRCRLQQHFDGCGADFTRRNAPLGVLEIRPASSEKDEYDVWCDYVKIYGLTRVGGWNYYLARDFGFKWYFRLPSLQFNKRQFA